MTLPPVELSLNMSFDLNLPIYASALCAATIATTLLLTELMAARRIDILSSIASIVALDALPPFSRSSFALEIFIISSAIVVTTDIIHPLISKYSKMQKPQKRTNNFKEGHLYLNLGCLESDNLSGIRKRFADYATEHRAEAIWDKIHIQRRNH